MNLLAVTLAPLVLGGCLLPAGVQVASLLADGVSLATTNKTLGDHGLSAVADQDCAVWRVINGEEVCRDYDSDDGPVMVADADRDAGKASEQPPPNVGPAKGMVDADDLNLVGAPEIEIARLEPLDAPAEPVTLAAVEEAPIAPTPPAGEIKQSDEQPSLPAAAKTNGGTFFVIASFSRLGGARRFARRHPSLATRVLAGTAKGKTVYRVATGPVDKARRPAVRAKLAEGGFEDAWVLTLKAPRVVVELAALN